MTSRRLLIAAACLTAASHAAAQRPEPPPTEIEGPAVGEQVRRDLNTLIQPGGSADTNALEARARGRLWTRPYATSVDGICRRDEVIVSYAGPAPYQAGIVANLTEPYGVAAQAWFRVMREIPAYSPRRSDRPFEGECATLTGLEPQGWFASESVHVAASGYRAFVAATRQINTPAHGIAGCRSLEEQRHCRNALRAPERIVRIASCPATGRRACYGISFADEMNEFEGVTIRLHNDGRGEPRIDAVEIHWPHISI
jgi:hypothetical protein